MSFVRDLLVKAGLVAPRGGASAAEAAPEVEIEPRSIPLADLVAESRGERVGGARARASATTGLSADIDTVLAAAGVKAPAHGWSIEKAVAFVGTPERAAAGRAEQHRALTVQLAIEGVRPEDVYADATARLKALDAYERFLASRVGDSTAALDDQIAEVRHQRDALEARLAAWHAQAQARRRAWAEALSFLTADGTLRADWRKVGGSGT